MLTAQFQYWSPLRPLTAAGSTGLGPQFESPRSELLCTYSLRRHTLPLTFFPNPIEETFLSTCSVLFDFSFTTSSSLTASTEYFFFFFFLCRGGSFFGKVNIGNITRNIAMAQRRNPLHLKNWEMWRAFMAFALWEQISKAEVCGDTILQKKNLLALINCKAVGSWTNYENTEILPCCGVNEKSTQ